MSEKKSLSFHDSRVQSFYNLLEAKLKNQKMSSSLMKNEVMLSSYEYVLFEEMIQEKIQKAKNEKEKKRLGNMWAMVRNVMDDKLLEEVRKIRREYETIKKIVEKTKYNSKTKKELKEYLLEGVNYEEVVLGGMRRKGRITRRRKK